MKVDVAIIGAGLTGMSLAVALAGAGRRVTVVDARGVPTGMPPGAHFDARIYAVSPASARWLELAHVWQALDASRITPVYDMQVYGDAARDLAGGLALSAYRAGVGELCTIIEESEMARVLGAAAGFASGIRMLRPVVPTGLRLDDRAACLTLADGNTLEASLVVAADGAHSWAREAAGIPVDQTDYHQSAVVANFESALPHRNRALQWFRQEEGGSGVLAWLPLPGNRISIVWSAPTEYAAALMALAPAEFAARVEAAGMHALGPLTLIDERASFPLSNRRAGSFIAPRLALVGDAAHVLHPLAGQGLNLGFGDCAELYRVLAGAGDCGEYTRLRAYERARKTALAELHALTHGLASLFAASHPALKGLRNFGLNLAGRLPVIPQWLVRAAADHG